MCELLNTPDDWIDRSKDLIKLTGEHPFNAEPNTKLLIDSGFVTPTHLHYVRNHSTVPKLDYDNHKITFSGLVKKQVEISMKDILKYDVHEVTVTLTCDGNRRKELNMIKRSKGFNWGSGATSTSTWRGVRVRDILEDIGVKEGAKYVWFEGPKDELTHGHYGTSISYSHVMDPFNDVLLAYEMNNEKLTPDHGAPIRVIIPGMVGGRSVKWLCNVKVSDEESDSWYHHHDNKVMPPSVDIYSVETKDWWKRSEFVLYELNINSSISHPGHQEKLSIDEPYILRGYAYSGGGRKVIRVDLSFDNCKTWVDAELKYNQEAKGSKPWSWCLWQYEIKNMQSLIQTTEITVRAVDSSFNMQPSERTWNVLGMMNNSYYRVKTSPIFDNDNKCFITFTHPVVPGSNGGGWMEELTTPIKPTIQNTYFSLDEIKKHNKENDCWLIIDNEVYDVTTYMKDHPGGSDSILVYGGKDVSQVFWLVHAMDATEMKERFCIGTVMPSSSSIKNTKSDLNPKRFIKAHLIKKVNLNHDTISMRFKVGNVTGMPIGQHVLFGAMINNDYVVRPYTPTYPIHQNEDEGVLEFVIKVYKETKNKPGGKMSCYLNEMKQGDVMQVKGPTGPILYHQNGMLTIHNKSVKALQLNMIAGGTGITPMFQIIRKVLECSGDDTLIKMVYANNTLEDILLKKELEELQNKYNKQFFVWHVLMESPKDQDFKCSVGFINEDILREHLYKADENSIVLICGPPVMIEACVRPSLDNMGYTDDNVFEF